MAVIRQERTARKPHGCSRCQGMIEPGQRYVRYAMTPNDPDFGNPRWWVLSQHADDNYLCLASSGRL